MKKKFFNLKSWYSNHLGFLLLAVMMIAGNVDVWGDTTLATVDFSESKWSDYDSENSITSSTTNEATVNGLSFKGYKTNGFYVSEGKLTFPGNNMSNSYYVGIPLSGINGSITVTITATKGYSYRYEFAADGAKTESNSTSDRADNDGSITITISNLTAKSGTFFIGRGSSNYQTINSITITTPESSSTTTDPTITFNNGTYTVGGTDLDLSTLFSSNSSGAVTYTVTDAGDTGASISGTSFTATAAGAATVQASQAANGSYNAKTATATITVSAAAATLPAPGISINGTSVRVTRPSGVSGQPTLYLKYDLTKGNVSTTVYDKSTTSTALNTTIPFGEYPEGSIQAMAVLDGVSSEIVSLGATVKPSVPTVEQDGSKVTFTMTGTSASSDKCYFEYKIGESGEIQKASTKTHEITITSTEKIYVKTTASYTMADGSTGYVASDFVEFTPTDPTSNKHTITFNANGGSGTMEAQLVNDNEATAINANTFTGADAATGFVGWNTAADGSGTDYTAGSNITLTDDIVLYAQWFRFSPKGSQNKTMVVGGSIQGYTFTFVSTKSLGLTADDFEVSTSDASVATATLRNIFENKNAVSIDVTGVGAGTANITVRFKGREGTLYGEASPYETFTVNAEEINTELLTIEDQSVFELTNSEKNFRAYEWINIDDQSDRVSLANGTNESATFKKGATYITNDRYFYLHSSDDKLEDSGFDGIKLNGNSSSSGHYLEMNVHGSGILTLQVWTGKGNDRTILVSSSNQFDDASIIASQQYVSDKEVKTFSIVVNNQGTRRLFLGVKGGSLRFGTFKWEPLAKPNLVISPESATIDINDVTKKVSDLTTITPTIESTGTAISNPVYKYTSSNTAVATVDENTGAITPVSEGSTDITIQLQSDGSTYGAQTAVLALTVTGTMKEEVTMSFSGNLAFTTSDAIPTVPTISIKDAEGADLSVAVAYSIEAGTTGLSIDSSTGALSGTVSAGTATVTATFAGDDTYKSATATYTITITATPVVAPVITITADGGDESFSMLLTAPSTNNNLEYSEAKNIYALSKYLNGDKKETKNNVYVTIESPQSGITIKYCEKLATKDSDFSKDYTEPIKAQMDKDRNISIDVSLGDQHWYGYYKFTSISEPTITADGENAEGYDSRNVTIAASTAPTGGNLYYTLDGSEATTSSNQFTDAFTLTESKVVKSALVYPGSMFVDGKEFSTINKISTVFIYDPTIFMADASADQSSKAYKLSAGDQVSLNDDKLVVTFGNTGKHNSTSGYVESSFGESAAANESGTIPSYADVYTDRQMFTGENPQIENGVYAAMGTEDGGTLFKTPIGGVMYRFEPTSNGVVTFWARQNGSLQYDSKNTSVDGGYSISRRPVYIMDEDGVYLRRNTNEEFTDIKDIDGVEAHISNLSTFGTDPANAMNYFKEHNPDNENYKYFASIYGENIKPTDKIGDIIYSETEAQANGVPMYGWECPEKNYVRYSFPVKAGKTYYLGGKGTKVGFAAVKFDEITTTSTDITIDQKSTSGLPSMEVGKQYNVTLNRTLTGGKWNALLLPFSVSETQLAEVFGEGVEVMFFENMPNSNTFNVLRHFYQMVYANVPCLVRPREDVSNPVFTNVTYAGNTIREQNVGYGYKVTGSYKKTVVKQYDYVTSWNDENALTFYQATGATEGSRTWNATRGWITSSDDQNLAPRVMSVGLGAYDNNDEATVIETIFNGSVLDGSYAPANNVKVGVYNISGQKIADTADNLPAGIYVVNGKKVIVK